MKWLVLATFLVIGCGDTDTQTQTVQACTGEDTDEAKVPLVPTPTCEPTEIVEVELPTVGMGTMLAICSDCDVGGCDDLGEPCAAYGMACDFGGEPGVCVSCCDGLTGELHCKPVN